MGNSESSPTETSASSSRKDKDKPPRDNAQGRSTSGSARRTAPRTYTPPGAAALPQAGGSLTSIAATPSTSTSTEHAQATIPSSSGAHARNRSTTAASAPLTHQADMGQSESRPPSRSSTLPAGREKDEAHPQPPTSNPVDVPQTSPHEGYHGHEKEAVTPSEETAPFGLPASVFSRPPRLPLPIERDPEESSPLITPQGTEPPPLQNSPLLTGTEPDNELGDLPKPASLLSSTTLDDDDGADVQQFTMETNPYAPVVKTTLTYRGEGKNVYVTGTFASWDKKFRMHRGADGVFLTTLPLPAGTHHLTFLVDGDPKTSRELPTTVDFANALVNYIEVVPPQSPTVEKAQPIYSQQQQQQQGPSEPIPIRSGTSRADDAIDPRSTDTVRAQQQAELAQAPNQPNQDPRSRPTSAQPNEKTAKPKPKPPAPRPKYTTTIPDVLLHLDLFNEPQDERFQRATKATSRLASPPSLPPYMSKSILNATTPQKDDASVLTMPNHTVLNHLATSSIRQGVLATSGTTRYRRKFLTTIVYKPKDEDSDG